MPKAVPCTRVAPELAAASAFIFSKLQTPVYKSSMELFIQPARTDFGLTQSAKQLLSSYIGIIFNKRNADVVRADLGLDYSPDHGATWIVAGCRTFRTMPSPFRPRSRRPCMSAAMPAFTYQPMRGKTGRR